MASIDVHPLTPERLADWLAFYDHDAFPDNPHWASCYCHFYLADHQEKPWPERDAAENRAASCALIGAGRLRGYLAYIDGKVAGWCHAGPRKLITNIDRDERYAAEDADQIGSIACFVVSPAFRRQGVARALLETACKDMRRAGLKAVEGYPRNDPEGDAGNYHGPLALYLEEGFAPVRKEQNVVIVRRALQ